MYMPGIFQQHASGPPCKSFLFLRPKALQLEAIKWRRASECVNARCATSALHNCAPHNPLHTAQ